MYVINQSKGIGQVVEIQETKVVVYFEEVDEEKTLLKAFTTIYNTLEEAEAALNPEIDTEAILANIEAEKKEHVENMQAIRRGEELRAKSTEELMKHI